MEYTEDKLTEWFDFGKVKPTNRGVYQVLYEYDDNTPTYSLFENGFFNFLAHEEKYAELYAEGKPTRHIIYFWRGLKSSPQAPQKPAKKKGNKKVARWMHITGMMGSELIHKVHGVYKTKREAEAARDKRNSKGWRSSIRRIRFRTPEA